MTSLQAEREHERELIRSKRQCFDEIIRQLEWHDDYDRQLRECRARIAALSGKTTACEYLRATGVEMFPKGDGHGAN